jgi:hypothetical protein
MAFRLVSCYSHPCHHPHNDVRRSRQRWSWRYTTGDIALQMLSIFSISEDDSLMLKKEPRPLDSSFSIGFARPNDRHRNAAQEDRHVGRRVVRRVRLICCCTAVAIALHAGRQYENAAFPVATSQLGIPGPPVFGKTAPSSQSMSVFSIMRYYDLCVAARDLPGALGKIGGANVPPGYGASVRSL